MNGFIWDAYQVRKGDYNQLTKRIWQVAFKNNEILEPFEDLEMRF